jgi:hypothetical protein
VKLSLESKILAACLALGALLRIYLAVAEFGMIHADEQFQTLEPAARFIYGFGTETWEWENGSRSWLVPIFYMPVLGPLKALGVTGGSIAIGACRLWMVLFSLLTLWRFHLLLRLRGIGALARFLSLGAFALLPAMIYWAPATFSDGWSAFFLWAGFAQAAFFFRGGRKLDAAAAALFFTLAFLVRIQLLPWAGSALLIFFLQARPARKEMMAAAILPLLGAGALDWYSWGFPFWSYYWNLAMNLLHGAADSNGTMPWWAYPRLLAENLGLPFFLAAAGSYLFCLLRPRRWEKVDYLIFAPALLHLAAHSLIPHKETRFMLPLLPLFFYAFAITADRILKASRRPATAPLLVLLSIAAFTFSAKDTLDPRRHYNELDISAPARLAYRDGLFEKYPDACLLLVHEDWLWSRGELGFGRKMKVVFTDDLKELTPGQVNQCAYAILPEPETTAFIWLANSQGNWRILGVDRWGHYLFRNMRAPLPGN